MNPLFITAMRLGDSLHVLPIASWFCKKNNTKLDWAIAEESYSLSLMEILAKQSIIERVYHFNYTDVRDPSWSEDIHSCHRPYHHIEASLNRSLGYRYKRIHSFAYDRQAYQKQELGCFSLHLAQDHDFSVDYNYTLEFGSPDSTYKDQTVIIDKLYQPQLQDIPGIYLDSKTPVLQNIRYAAGAKKVITTRTGAAIFLSLARIPYHLIFTDSDLDWYLKMCHEINGGILVQEP